MTKTEKAQFAELLLTVGVLKSQLAAATTAPVLEAPAPVVQMKQQPDTWVPRFDALTYSRPPLAFFVERDDAFEYRAAMAANPEALAALRAAMGYTSRTPQAVCVGRDCRTPSGAIVNAVY